MTQVLISWVVVLVRRYAGTPTLTSPTAISHPLRRWSRGRRMFTIHCENIVRAANRKANPQHTDGGVELLRANTSLIRGGPNRTASQGSPRSSSPPNFINSEIRRRAPRRLRPDMIRRVDDVPKLVNPSGSISEGQAGPTDILSVTGSDNRAQSLSEGLHHSPLPLGHENRSRSPIQSVSSGQPRVGRSPMRRS
jgi:hypothetical protein